jgi:hypothetical protein
LSSGVAIIHRKTGVFAETDHRATIAHNNTHHKMADEIRIPSPLLGQIVSYLPKTPDPFLTHRLVEDMASYPGRNNGDINFVVDCSKKGARIQAALSNASNVFAFKGAIDEPYGFWEPTKWMPLFHGVLSEEEQQAAEKLLKQKELPIDALLKVASPAPFGRDGETVFDPKIRKAFEIPRSRLPSGLLQALAFSSCWNFKEMEEAMKPECKNWACQLYKIHMYGPGGKFEDHVDTLHKNNHVATIVLSLPSEHDGGVLQVRHHGEAMKFNSAKGPKQQKYGSGRMFRFAAFFTDCTHSVEEVISGWRVVVQYDVYENEECNESQTDNEAIDSSDEVGEDAIEEVRWCLESRHSVGTSNIRDKEQTELMQAVSQYMAKIPPAHGVAFFLRHRYSLPALNEIVLKGADRTIYDAFSKRGDWSISIQGVLVYVQTEERRQVLVQVKAVSMEDLLPEDDDKRSSDSDDSTTAAGGKRKRKKAATNAVISKESTVHLIVDQNNGAMRVHYCGETGNEPADGYTSYFVACMIIRSIEGRKPAAEQQNP